MNFKSSSVRLMMTGVIFSGGNLFSNDQFFHVGGSLVAETDSAGQRLNQRRARRIDCVGRAFRAHVRHPFEQNFLCVPSFQPRPLVQNREQKFFHGLAFFYPANFAKIFFGRTERVAFFAFVPAFEEPKFFSAFLRQKRFQNRRAEFFVGEIFGAFFAASNFFRRQNYFFGREFFGGRVKIFFDVNDLKTFDDFYFLDGRFVLRKIFVDRVENFFREKFQLVVEGRTFPANKKRAVFDFDGRDVRGNFFVDEPAPIFYHFRAENFFMLSHCVSLPSSTEKNFPKLCGGKYARSVAVISV